MNGMLRIIPRLDIKNNTVIKGIHLEGLRVVGVPAEAARKYYEQGADEILCMDAVASLYERNSLKSIIELVSQEVFVPLTVGGGLRTLKDIKEILRAGADKVAINTQAIKTPEFIRQASMMFGSQCIVGSIEAKKTASGQWEAFIDTGREATGVNAIDWAHALAELGAGELLITSIDNEGVQNGFETELIQKISDSVPIPVIACGGCGHHSHIQQLYSAAPVSAVACASIFHYDKYTIGEVKQSLFSTGIEISLRSGVQHEISHH